MKWNKEMLIEAVRNTNLLPEKQKQALEVICNSKYPLPSKIIEEKVGTTKQRLAYSLRALERRNFIVREKDGAYVYRPNYTRIEELIERYLDK